MIKKSFKTIFEFPLILLGFALPVVFVGVAYIPMLSMLGPNADYTMVITMMVTMLFVFLFALALQFVYMPVLLNYTYEASMGKVEAGWFKRGLKRNWWKVFVGTIIASVPMYIVYFLFAIGTMVSVLLAENYSYAPLAIAISLYFIFILFWVGFYYTTLVSITAEDKFDTGFKNIFKVGFKNILNVTAASFVSMLPAILVSGLYILYFALIGASSIIPYGASELAVFENTPLMVGVIVIAIVFTALNALGMAFIYVYTYKHYIKRRDELMPAPAAETATDETTL